MDTLLIDTLACETSKNEVQTLVETSIFSANAWTYIAIIELAIIIGLLFLLTRKGHNKYKEEKERALSENVDFGNIINSAFHANNLYNSLKVKCHPDRFPNDEEKIAKALEISQLIGKYKNNIKMLEELKLRAQNELNIKL